MDSNRIYHNSNYEVLSDIPASATGYLRQLRCRCSLNALNWTRCRHSAIRSHGMVTQNMIGVVDEELVSLTFLRESCICEECGASAVAWDPEFPDNDPITPEAKEFLSKKAASDFFREGRSDIVPLLKHYIRSNLPSVTGSYRERFSDITTWRAPVCLRFIATSYRDTPVHIITASSRQDGSDPFLLTLLDGHDPNDLSAFLEKIPDRNQIKSILVELGDPFVQTIREYFPHALISYSKDSVTRMFRSYTNDPKDASLEERTKQANLLFLRMFHSGDADLPTEMSRWEDHMLSDDQLSTQSRNMLRDLLDKLRLADTTALSQVRRFPSLWLGGNDVSDVMKAMEQKKIPYADMEMMILRSEATHFSGLDPLSKMEVYTDPLLLKVLYLEDSSLYLFLQMD